MCTEGLFLISSFCFLTEQRSTTAQAACSVCPETVLLPSVTERKKFHLSVYWMTPIGKFLWAQSTKPLAVQHKYTNKMHPTSLFTWSDSAAEIVFHNISAWTKIEDIASTGHHWERKEENRCKLWCVKRTVCTTHSLVKSPTRTRDRTSSGTVPVSMFSWSSNLRSFVRRPSDAGIPPASLFRWILLQRDTNRLFLAVGDDRCLSISPSEKELVVAGLIQETQRRDVPERARYRPSEMVAVKIKADQSPQVSQGRWYSPTHFVLIQLPVKMRMSFCTVGKLWV